MIAFHSLIIVESQSSASVKNQELANIGVDFLVP